MDDAERDVLAHMAFPKEHLVKLHSTNPIERLNGEIKRRTGVVGILSARLFPYAKTSTVICTVRSRSMKLARQ